MSEPDKCNFCQTGEVLWIPAENGYSLWCSHCGATGSYALQIPPTAPAQDTGSGDLPITPERWRDILDTALEHASHAWAALSRAGAKEESPDLWPPKSLDPVRSAAYHTAAMIDYVFDVYSGIRRLYPDDEQEPPQ